MTFEQFKTEKHGAKELSPLQLAALRKEYDATYQSPASADTATDSKQAEIDRLLAVVAALQAKANVKRFGVTVDTKRVVVWLNIATDTLETVKDALQVTDNIKLRTSERVVDEVVKSSSRIALITVPAGVTAFEYAEKIVGSARSRGIDIG